MGLFDKKQCAICGKDIGLFGNRKLTDGNMCKDCASKLSPWFSDRKQSTVEQIKEQLAYREQNQVNLGSFRPTKTFDLETNIYIDESAKTFVVTRSSDYVKANSDLVSTSQIRSIDLDIRERKTEKKQLVDGKYVSYSPAQYDYDYTFYMTINTDSPWFDDIGFEVANGTEPERKGDDAYIQLEKLSHDIMTALRPDLYPEWNPPVQAVSGAAKPIFSKPSVTVTQSDEKWRCECGALNDASNNFCGKCGKKRVIKWFCPNCGKENHGRFCVGCGTEMPAEALEPATKKVLKTPGKLDL